MAMAILPPDPVFILRGKKPIQSLAFHKGWDRLLCGDLEGVVHIWGLQTNRIESTLTVGTDMIINMHHTSDQLITQDKHGTVQFWNLAKKGYELGDVIKTSYLGFCKFNISESDNLIIVPEKDSRAKAYDLNARFIMEFIPEDPNSLGIVMCTKIITLNKEIFILIAYESGDLILFNLGTGKAVTQLKLNEFPITIDYDVVANRGVYGSSSNTVQVFYIDQNKELRKKCDLNLKNEGVNHLQIRKDKKVFASAGWDGRLRIFSWKTLRPLAVMNTHEGPINTISYSEDKISTWSSPILAAASSDGNISLWDLYN